MKCIDDETVDETVDETPFQQQRIELTLRSLRESTQPMHIVSFGSVRAIAVTYQRDPAPSTEKLP